MFDYLHKYNYKNDLFHNFDTFDQTQEAKDRLYWNV
jgi:hypothetical protein